MSLLFIRARVQRATVFLPVAGCAAAGVPGGGIILRIGSGAQKQICARAAARAGPAAKAGAVKTEKMGAKMTEGITLEETAAHFGALPSAAAHARYSSTV